MAESKNVRETHILKLVLKGRTFDQPDGIKCYPRQTYGVSEQSPQTFRTTNGVIAQNGYCFDEQRFKNYSPLSQNRFFGVVGKNVETIDTFHQNYKTSLKNNSEHFHKKKGKFTEFSDKNLWMKHVYKMTGVQRSDQSRKASNQQRDRSIKFARKYKQYKNPVQKTFSVTKQNCIKSGLITERARIKLQRLSLNKNKKNAQEQQRIIRTSYQPTPENDKYLDAESLTNKMSNTMKSKEWRYTMTSIRKKFKKQGQKNGMNLTSSDWSTNNKSVQLKPNQKQSDKDHLKEWFNTTLHDNGNPWVYKKPRKQDAGSDEQQVQN